MVCSQKSVTSNKIDSTVCHIKLVLDEKAQPNIHTLGAPHHKANFWFLRKLKDFKCTLWSKKCGNGS